MAVCVIFCWWKGCTGWLDPILMKGIHWLNPALMEAMIWLAGQLPALMKKAQWLAVYNLDDWQASWILISGFRTGPHWLAGSDDGRSHEGHQRLSGPVDGLPKKAIPNWKRREAADHGFLHLHTHVALCHKSQNVQLQLFRPSNCQNMMHCVFVKHFTIYIPVNRFFFHRKEGSFLLRKATCRRVESPGLSFLTNPHKW